MGIKMFCGELNGEIEPAHIGFRADGVRDSISLMFRSEAYGTLSKTGKADFSRLGLWKRAQRGGWRVVPVEVRKINSP